MPRMCPAHYWLPADALTFRGVHAYVCLLTTRYILWYTPWQKLEATKAMRAQGLSRRMSAKQARNLNMNALARIEAHASASSMTSHISDTHAEASGRAALALLEGGGDRSQPSTPHSETEYGTGHKGWGWGSVVCA
jgi:hypothetical protein